MKGERGKLVLIALLALSDQFYHIEKEETRRVRISTISSSKMVSIQLLSRFNRPSVELDEISAPLSMGGHVASKVGPIFNHPLADQALKEFRPTVDNVGVLPGALGAGQHAVAEVATDSAVGHLSQVRIATI